MSVAIQGDWGTGKTSLISMLKPEMKQRNIHYVYFNTWQYSQFGMAEDLYMSFVHTLIKKCAPAAEEGRTLLGKVQKVLTEAIVYEEEEEERYHYLERSLCMDEKEANEYQRFVLLLEDDLMNFCPVSYKKLSKSVEELPAGRKDPQEHNNSQFGAEHRNH